MYRDRYSKNTFVINFSLRISLRLKMIINNVQVALNNCSYFSVPTKTYQGLTYISASMATGSEKFPSDHRAEASMIDDNENYSCELARRI